MRPETLPAIVLETNKINDKNIKIDLISRVIQVEISLDYAK
jgi:hypothetical protein